MPSGKNQKDIASTTNQSVPTQTSNDDATEKVSTEKPQKTTEPIYKKWWFWVIIAIFTLGAIGVIASGGLTDKNEGDKNSSAPTDQSSSQADNNQSSTEQPTNQSEDKSSDASQSNSSEGYKVGDTIELKDSKVTISNVERNFSTGNMFDKPEEGKEFIKIGVGFVNTTTSKKTFYPSNWQLQDGDGVIRDISYSTTMMIDNGFYESIELAGNGKWSGFMIFEIPAGGGNLQLQYKPSLLSKTTIINL